MFLFFVLLTLLGCLQGAASAAIDPSGDEAESQLACIYQCDNGGTAVDNPEHRPSYNGCGSYGVGIDFNKCGYLNGCCNLHDLCYDRCGTSRDRCDDEFRACTSNAPSTMIKDAKGFCSAAGETMYYLVRLAGCSAFKSAQKNACICV